MDGSIPNSAGRQVARRIVTIGAGKGGVGASMIATNLGIFLAQIGKRVVVIDANLPDPSLYSWLGAPRPASTIADVLLGRVQRLEDAVVETRVTGLGLLAGAADLCGHTELDAHARGALWSQVRELETDFVLIDLPAGLHPLTLDFFGFLHELLRHPDTDRDSLDLLNELASRSGRPPTVREIVSVLSERQSPLYDEAARLAATLHPQLIVNKTRIKADEEVGDAMVSAAARWIGVVPGLLGSVGWDDNVWLTLRRGKTLLIDFSRSRACKDLERIVRRLLNQDFRDLFTPAAVPPPTREQNLYELLEIYPGASEEEVRRALKRIREWFGIDGLAASGACSDEEREGYQQAAEEAHATLLDKSKRREYDRGHFPDGFPAPGRRFPSERDSIAGTVATTRDSLPLVELTDATLVDGAFLGRIRRERNVELIDISNRAKISKSYLKAIEEERFEELPAPVFIRGFVTEYARFLKIDPQRAVRDFMAKYDAAIRRAR
ncbi:MAG: helix-turn-helix domain-containing protein [Deltaproteobacteria bacterium]|nr:helix-turn-helix domain-containing protein [Deltaproteobacteria bacterium]